MTDITTATQSLPEVEAIAAEEATPQFITFEHFSKMFPTSAQAADVWTGLIKGNLPVAPDWDGATQAAPAVPVPFAELFPNAPHEAISFGIWVGILQQMFKDKFNWDDYVTDGNAGVMKEQYYDNAMSPKEAFDEEVSCF